MILVYIEVRDGKVKKSSLEALSEGKRRASELNTELHAVLVGYNLEGLSAETFKFGASKTYVLESSLLSHYSPSGYTYALQSLCKETSPDIVLFSATSLGKDLAPRLAAKLGVSLAADCIKTEVKDGELEVLRPVFAGKAFATLRFKSSPVLASLRPNVFPLINPQDEKSDVDKRDVVVPEDEVKDRVQEVLKEEGVALDVTEAEIIEAIRAEA